MARRYFAVDVLISGRIYSLTQKKANSASWLATATGTNSLRDPCSKRARKGTAHIQDNKRNYELSNTGKIVALHVRALCKRSAWLLSLASLARTRLSGIWDSLRNIGCLQESEVLKACHWHFQRLFDLCYLARRRQSDTRRSPCSRQTCLIVTPNLPQKAYRSSLSWLTKCSKHAGVADRSPLKNPLKKILSCLWLNKTKNGVHGYWLFLYDLDSLDPTVVWPSDIVKL